LRSKLLYNFIVPRKTVWASDGGRYESRYSPKDPPILGKFKFFAWITDEYFAKFSPLAVLGVYQAGLRISAATDLSEDFRPVARKYLWNQRTEELKAA